MAVVGDASSEAGRFLFKGSADFVQHSFASFASPPGRLRNTLTKSTRQLTKPDFVNLIWAEIAGILAAMAGPCQRGPHAAGNAVEGNPQLRVSNFCLLHLAGFVGLVGPYRTIWIHLDL